MLRNSLFILAEGSGNCKKNFCFLVKILFFGGTPRGFRRKGLQIGGTYCKIIQLILLLQINYLREDPIYDYCRRIQKRRYL